MSSAGGGKKFLRRAARTGQEMGREFATLITNAFGLIAALAWSDAIKAIFDKLAKFKYWPFSGPVMFAVLITVLAYVATVTVGRLSKDSCTKMCAPDDPQATLAPTMAPTMAPTSAPTTSSPTFGPTSSPTFGPTSRNPSQAPVSVAPK
jgi:hypothetical protein